MMFHILYSLARPLITSPPFNNTVISAASARSPTPPQRGCIMGSPPHDCGLGSGRRTLIWDYTTTPLHPTDPKSTALTASLSPPYLQ